ncbi:extracellular solute-binding protein [Dickeya undicola]|uniref:Extracellular solute-binding protein n=1 Tax=Dickeya undicola TaxID=1577887 RepID=A0ABX9WS23_9GAMM|nr:extracellular solute-binding protein [Dickeya undicola]RNM22714.1 extracellular solute-binding protein [Dickeya undicola]
MMTVCKGWRYVSGALCALLLTAQAQAATEVNFWYSGGTKPQKMMLTLIDEFNRSQDQFVVKGALQGNYDETWQKLQAGMAAKNAPAFALLNASQGTALAERKLLRDLRPYMDDSFHFTDFIGAFRRQVTQPDGSVYGLPAYGTTQVLYYNKAVLAQHGFTPDDLKTWQGLAKVATAVTQKEADGNTRYYGWEPMWGPGNLIDAALSNGGRILSDDGKKVLIDSPAWVEVWDSFRRWIHEEHIMRIYHGGQGWEYWYKTIDDVMKDRALGYTGSSGDQGDLDFQRLAALPQPGWGSHPSAPQAGALIFVMPVGTPDAAAKGAFAFMRFYTSAVNTARWSMFTGYIPVRESVLQDADYQKYVAANPQAAVPVQQAKSASMDFIDPTKGKILDALTVAADQVEIENKPAQQVLTEAARKAQKALDRLHE